MHTTSLLNNPIDYVFDFAETFGPQHTVLAMHAALPLGLSPEVLHLIRVNFLARDPWRVPWIAEADLLLSPLCQHLGGEMYQMPSEIRSFLIDQMRQEAVFSSERITHVAQYLAAYTSFKLAQIRNDRESIEFYQVLHWSALSYLSPEIAARTLALAFRQEFESGNPNRGHTAGLLRLAEVADDLALLLLGQDELLLYASMIGNVVLKRYEDAERLAKVLETGEETIDVAGIALPSATKLVKTLENTRFTSRLREKRVYSDTKWEDIADILSDSSVRLIRIFISSPGDVNEERSIVLDIIQKVAQDPLLQNRINLEVVGWESNRAPMLATLTPAEAINYSLPKPSECDIVVVILWSRMGTPLPFPEFQKPDGEPYYSGTEWEYLDAQHASTAHPQGLPLIVVYRRTERVRIEPVDPEFNLKRQQYERVNTFWEHFQDESGAITHGYNLYENPQEFRQKFENDLRELVKIRLAMPETHTPPEITARSPETETWPPNTSPFPGLRAFTPDDALVFFGRSRETNLLIERLREQSFLSVVGPSGSGKSSLIGAGLIPRLWQNAIPGSKNWRWLRFTPGELSDSPFAAFATQLAPMIPKVRPREIASQLVNNPDTIHEYVVQALVGLPSGVKLLVVVDQFEELFTLVNPDYRAAFISLLEAAARTERLCTILAIRADFYHRCVEYPKLAELLSEDSFPLAVPKWDDMLEMIEQPAVVAGLVFEQGLPSRILHDTGQEPGALASLAYTLHELYLQAEIQHGKKFLSFRDYDALGGVQGIISTRAERIFAQLDRTAQETMPHLFIELIEVDRGSVSRKRARLKRFKGLSQNIIETLTNAQLLITSGNNQDSFVEIAHEALLHSWPRLKDWIESSQEDLRLLSQVQQAAKEWNAHSRNSEFLWSSEQLQLVSAMMDRLNPNLDVVTNEFIHAKTNLPILVSQLSGEIEKISKLVGALYYPETIIPVLESYKEQFDSGIVSFRMTAQSSAEPELSITYLDMMTPHDPYITAVNYGFLTESGHPAESLIREIQNRYPVVGYGVNVSCNRGFKEISILFSNRIPIENLLQLSSIPPSTKGLADFLKQYNLQQCNLVSIDFLKGNFNIHFMFRDSKRNIRTIVDGLFNDLGFQLPSQRELELLNEHNELFFTFNWNESVCERICFIYPVRSEAQLPEYLRPMFHNSRHMSFREFYPRKHSNNLEIEIEYKGMSLDGIKL